ncbi:MAG: addiction module protein [Betaproteobacteria bacterium RIFCSPLOWO2_02_FULL_67_26]|nr:MAG: addiction module protein [Betaproteobacteria bacterium RIFCSPLOWO2_02_FULL_67_26]
MATNELYYYQTASGEQPFVEWLAGLADKQARARIEARLARVAAGTLGDVKTAGEGVLELRVDWGPGYRVYFSRVGQVIVLLLCGGDKRTQQEDIKRAKAYFKDYKARSAKRAPRGRA